VANKTFFVDTGSTTGGDGTTDATTGANRAFASIADADANIASGDKSIASGEWVAILCNNSGGKDTATVDIGTDWTFADATSLLYIMSNDDTNSNTDPLGIATKTCHFDGTVDSGYVINVFDNCFNGHTNTNIVLQGIEVDGDDRTFRSGINLGADSVARNCMAHNIANGIKVYRGTTENCIAFDCGTAGFHTYGNFGDADYLNCTSIDNGSGFETPAGGSNNPSYYNCVAFGNTTNWDDNGSGYGTSDHNAGETGDTIAGTDSVTGLTSAAFLDYAGNDYRIGTGSALEDAGGTNGTTFDVEGTTRSSADIGFFEFVSSGGSLSAGTATAAWTGQSASLNAVGALSATTATASWTGQAATLTAPGVLNASTATAAWTGQAASLAAAGSLSATTATAAWSGQSATLTAAGLLSATTATAAWTGQSATLAAPATLVATTATAAWTGQAASLNAIGSLTAVTATASWTGQQASLTVPGATLAATTATAAWTGQSASLAAIGNLTATTASAAWTGQQASFSAQQLQALTASAAWTGQAAALAEIPALPDRPADSTMWPNYRALVYQNQPKPQKIRNGEIGTTARWYLDVGPYIDREGLTVTGFTVARSTRNSSVEVGDVIEYADGVIGWDAVFTSNGKSTIDVTTVFSDGDTFLTQFDFNTFTPTTASTDTPFTDYI